MYLHMKFKVESMRLNQRKDGLVAYTLTIPTHNREWHDYSLTLLYNTTFVCRFLCFRNFFFHFFFIIFFGVLINNLSYNTISKMNYVSRNEKHIW